MSRRPHGQDRPLCSRSRTQGQGIVYRFDTRDYWGYNKGVTKLLFGGSDDDIAFALDGKKDYLGNQISQNEQSRTLGYSKEISRDPSFTKLIWGRVVAGNVEGAIGNATLDPNVTGFKTDYVEAGQLVYTLSRPDVYNAIMALPWWANQLEDELGQHGPSETGANRRGQTTARRTA